MSAFIISSGISSVSKNAGSVSNVKDDAIASTFASAIKSKGGFAKKKEPKYLYGPKRINQPAKFEIPSRNACNDNDCRLIME